MLSIFLLACSTPDPAPAPPPIAAPAPAPAAAPAPAPAARAPNKRPPALRDIALAPVRPVASDTLTVTVDAVDPDGDPLDVDVTWFVNDAEILGVTAETLSGRFAKGDVVRVRVTVEGEGGDVSMDGPSVTIGNRPPVFEPVGSLGKVDGFRFRATDPDGDTLSWRLEGAPAGMTISADGVLAYAGSASEPGGAYTVAVVADDGAGYGRYEFPLTVSAGSRAPGR
jgi:hypothetical protein